MNACFTSPFCEQADVRIWGAERPDEHSPLAMKSPGSVVWFAISK